MIEQMEKSSVLEKRHNPPTIQDVATALGMHKSTVSVALSGKGTLAARTRDHILAVAREMGYEPNPLAQRLASGHRNQAVCIVSGVLDMGLTTEKILLIQRELASHALEIPIYTCTEGVTPDSRSQAEQVKQICRQRPRAIICASQLINSGVFEEFTQYQAGGGVVISYDTAIPLACDQVVFDREHNAYQAATYLLERGHRKIGMSMSNNVGWMAYKGRLSQPGRMLGYTKALEDYGIEVREDFLFQHGTYERGGQELARQFFALEDRPTAMCIVNDYVALAFMVEVMRQGVRIPQDLSVIGHDNQAIATYCPVPLTSATQPADAIARTVVRLLLERLNGVSDRPQTVIIRGDLAERDSVAPLS